MTRFLLSAVLLLCGVTVSAAERKPNVLFLIADDLTLTALGCYGNAVCRTPNIDRLAAAGTRFDRAYCQATFCGPSRASLMSGYYPHATNVFGYVSGRAAIGERATWPQHFQNHGYHTARVSKIFHMGVPGDIEKGSDGTDDPASWTERFNSPGPEWKAPGTGETLEGNPDGKKPVVGGNTFVVVEADGDDLAHADGRTAAKACEFLKQRAAKPDEPFFLAVGFVRPHVPFVAPKAYFTPYLPYDRMTLPEKVKGDWDDIPKAGINYKTSVNMQMDERKQRKAIGGYYAAVSYMDAQVGKVLDALKANVLDSNTIVIFTSDHGYHLGEHDFWAKVSVHEESAAVPLIIKVPGKAPAVCHSFAELLDLYPTISKLWRCRPASRARTSRRCSTTRSTSSATQPSASTARIRGSCCGKRCGRTSSTARPRPRGSNCSTWRPTRSSTPTSPFGPSIRASWTGSRPSSPRSSRPCGPTTSLAPDFGLLLFLGVGELWPRGSIEAEGEVRSRRRRLPQAVSLMQRQMLRGGQRRREQKGQDHQANKERRGVPVRTRQGLDGVIMTVMDQRGNSKTVCGELRPVLNIDIDSL